MTVYATSENQVRERRKKKLNKLLPPDSHIKAIQYQQQKSVDANSKGERPRQG